jgi:hypothetical protein
VIDDPAAWTEGFESWVDSISDFSEVPISNIRRRVAQLISGWGGVAAYGAKAAERLRREVEPLGLLLPFVRPHIGILLACIACGHRGILASVKADRDAGGPSSSSPSRRSSSSTSQCIFFSSHRP